MNQTRPLPAVRTIEEAINAITSAAAVCTERVRIEVPIQKPVSSLVWLSAQPAGQRLYWKDAADLEVAGWGFADRQTHLPAGHGWRYFGGMAFDPDAPADAHWAPFGRRCFWLPRVTLETTGAGQVLAVHCLGTPVDLSDLSASVSTQTGALVGSLSGHAPDLAGWSMGIEGAIASFAQGHMRKVVLARQTDVSLERPVDPFDLLHRMRQRGVFVFGFEVAPGHAFVGCSPERLFRRQGRTLATEALAGTRRRGHTRRQDLLLAAELRGDAKEQVEHHHVVEAIEADLAGLCTSLHRDAAPRVRRLDRVQHLHTPFSGVLQDGVTDGDLLAAMHPTPAVCGRPTDRARTFIQQTESFDRGWYAGPVGWLDGDSAEFAVAIRSALLVGNRLRFYTGAGIVPASRPEAEWSELDAKSGGITGLLESRESA